jgi:hypothetical protein
VRSIRLAATGIGPPIFAGAARPRVRETREASARDGP